MTEAKPSCIPSAEVVRSVLDLYERGLVGEAFQRASAFAPLPRWDGVEGGTLAARLAANLGGPRLAHRLTVRAWRQAPADPRAQLQYGLLVLEQRGPVALWLAMRQWPTPAFTAPGPQAELLALRAVAHGSLRDFAVAESLMDQAETLAPDEPWVRLQRAVLWQQQDRLEEALETAQAARALHPYPCHRPSVQLLASLLQQLDRDDEAIAMLQEAASVLQSALIAGQLYGLLSENGRWAEAERALERFVALAPLLEPRLHQWMSAQRARTAYHLGRREDAARLAGGLADDYSKAFARRLAAPAPSPERVQLEVSFVRQHFKTCAPATLAALGAYWKMPAAHLQLAEAMCYDGTPAWQQREWAQRHGWLVREFRMTHDCAVALIERGVPFALSVVDATAAHMLAVIGFDRTRDTLLLRDPGQPYVLEAPAEEFVTRYSPFGPRGTVFLPTAERARLDGLPLPEAELYDASHAMWLALVAHDRAGAATALQALEAAAPDAALTWEARGELAAYDANWVEQARCLDRLLELFPQATARVLRKLSCAREAPRVERLRLLQAAREATGEAPAVLVELGRELLGDAREAAQAERLAQRALRRQPLDSGVIRLLAGLRWERGDLEEATELFRFAANVESFREDLYQAWFAACRRTRRSREALAHLQDRFRRFGARSEQPGLTLAGAYRDLDQAAEARRVLAEARALRPDDCNLALRAGGMLARFGDLAEAERCLAETQGKVREADWLRAAAELAECRHDVPATLRWTRTILEREPLAMDAHSALARWTAWQEGPAAALRQLEAACARNPEHCGLQRLRVDFSRPAGPAAARAAAAALLRLEPADAWARRELAWALCLSGEGEAALREAAEAVRIEPLNSYSFSARGSIHVRQRQVAEARADFRRAVELSVDNAHAIAALLELAPSDPERREELAFVERQLVEQVVTGDGLLAFLNFARPLLEPATLTEWLRAAHQSRPDLWHAWSALVSQLAHSGQLDAALPLAREATDRFPHWPRVWLDLADLHRRRGEPAPEVAAAERAFDMNPAWNRTALALADALERQGRLKESASVLERALNHAPTDAELRASHASALWRLREPGAAFGAIEQALRLDPGLERGWRLLHTWAAESGQPQRAVAVARQLTRDRPGEPRLWLMLARMLEAPRDLAEQLEVVERALALDPRPAESWDLKAWLLTSAERFDEAIAACDAGAAQGGGETFVLLGRRAWIEAQRGRLPEALDQMRAVLAGNAAYAWGWNQLALWCSRQNDHDGAEQALERLLKLQPQEGWVQGQLGLVRLNKQDEAGARAAFAEALRHSPEDQPAAANLFDLQLKAGDVPGAEATLQVMQLHQPGARTRAAEVRLQLQRKDRARALASFAALCRTPDPDAWPLQSATAELERAGEAGRARKVLEQSLAEPGASPEAAAMLLKLLLRQRRAWPATRRFFRLPAGEAKRRAADQLLQGLADGGHGWLLRWLLAREREFLYGDDTAWGRAGYALLRCQRAQATAAWLSNWRQRTQAQPWMLFNQCVALRQLGRYEEATEVARHVVEARGHQPGAQDLRLFLAIEAALAGQTEPAEAHLRAAPVRADNPYDQQLLALAKALVEIQKEAPEDRARAFGSIRKRLAGVFPGSAPFGCMKDVRRTFKRAGKAFARAGAGGLAGWWFAWKAGWVWAAIALGILSLAGLVAALASPDAERLSRLAPAAVAVLFITLLRARKP